MADSSKTKNYSMPVLVLLLVGAAFAIGTMWQKIQTLETKKTASGDTVAVAGNAAGTNNNKAAGTANHDPISLAKELGYDTEKIQTCMDDSASAELVSEDYDSGLTAGVNGTPGNIVIHTSGTKVLVPGALPYAQIKGLVDDLLDDGQSAQATDINIAPVTAADHTKGSPDADITWVEYSDLECPFCARIHPDLIKLLTEYDGKVRWVYRHFPLSQLHPNAEGLARASECIAQLEGEDAFWGYIDHVYANQ
jgi:protein-disulfide isomerase